MAIWEYQASGSIAKEPTIYKTLPTDNTSYGQEYIYDLAPPDRKFTLTCSGLNGTELSAVETAAMTRNAVLSVTDSTGTTRTGRLESCSWEVISGTNLYRATIVLRDRTNEASNNLTATPTI